MHCMVTLHGSIHHQYVGSHNSCVGGFSGCKQSHVECVNTCRCTVLRQIYLFIHGDVQLCSKFSCFALIIYAIQKQKKGSSVYCVTRPPILISSQERKKTLILECNLTYDHKSHGDGLRRWETTYNKQLHIMCNTSYLTLYPSFDMEISFT